MGSGFEARALAVAGQQSAYRVHLPPGGGSGAPVLLFLHGVGERGRDNVRHLRLGLPPRIAASPEEWPFVVVAPQCPEQRLWPEPEGQALALAALDDAVRAFAADGARVAVTGISMGGYGAIELGGRWPGRFAALAVVCGGVAEARSLPAPHADLALRAAPADPYAEAARRLGTLPVWLLHGALDDVVPVEESRRLHAALREAGGDVRYTEYPGVRHDSWDRAYAEPELPGWLRARLGA
jgi:predicted peptidase